jgi:hypothetical protein
MDFFFFRFRFVDFWVLPQAEPMVPGGGGAAFAAACFFSAIPGAAIC